MLPFPLENRIVMKRVVTLFIALLTLLTVMAAQARKKTPTGGVPDFAYPEKVLVTAQKDLTAALKSGNGEATVNALVRYGLAKSAVSADSLKSVISRIDGIRLCFHQKDACEAVRMGQEILDKGYQLLLQPMVCTRYTDEEFKALMVYAQERLKGLSAFYLVDSFGSMGQEEVVQRLRLADGCLKPEISLGLHTHNNLQLSFPNAAAALNMGLERKLMIDGTLAGMGKGPGNLPTEDFAEYLNRNFGKTYDLWGLRDAAERIVKPMKEKHSWGYRPEFSLSAKYCLSPSYAKLFFDDYHLPVETVNELLMRIPDEKKDSFDRQMAEEVLADYRKKCGKVKIDEVRKGEELW